MPPFWRSPPSWRRQRPARNTTDRSAKPLTIAVIGDVRYGTAQEATFGGLIGAINADPKVRIVAHLIDIKSGSTTWSDEPFAVVAAAFETFTDPVVYTPGDNEWTDCHRVNNGSYHPLERLAAVREVFFAEPGGTLGRHPMRVDYQPALIENVRWIASRVAFTARHVIGSNNGLAPWSGLGHTTPTAAQTAEVSQRIAATFDWIDDTFDTAEVGGLRGVVLAMQADTWDPAPAGAQEAIVARIAERTAAFEGQVLLLQGDSHVYTADNPLSLLNFIRIVVHGETLPFEYPLLMINPRDPGVFSWERVPVSAA